MNTENSPYIDRSLTPSGEHLSSGRSAFQEQVRNLMSEGTTINIAKDFSAYPIGRDYNDSPEANGRKFRELLVLKLNEARSSNSTVVVDFEGVESFGSSFLEEAFGGLVRENGWTVAELKRHLSITYDWAGYARAERQAWHHINNAKPAH